MKRNDMQEEGQIKRMLKEIPLEQLPEDFTKQVMGRIQQETDTALSIRYTPLITWRSAIYIGFLFALFVALILGGSIEMPALHSLLLERLPISLDILPSISDKISTGIMIYSMVVLILGIGFQFYHVKRWHSRRFAMH